MKEVTIFGVAFDTHGFGCDSIGIFSAADFGGE